MGAVERGVVPLQTARAEDRARDGLAAHGAEGIGLVAHAASRPGAEVPLLVMERSLVMPRGALGAGQGEEVSPRGGPRARVARDVGFERPELGRLLRLGFIDVLVLEQGEGMAQL